MLGADVLEGPVNPANLLGINVLRSSCDGDCCRLRLSDVEQDSNTHVAHDVDAGANHRFWHVLLIVSSLYSWPSCLNPEILRRSHKVFLMFSTVQLKSERRLAIDSLDTGYASLAYIQ